MSNLKQKIADIIGEDANDIVATPVDGDVYEFEDSILGKLDFTVDFNEVVEGGFIPSGSGSNDAFVKLIELISNYPSYEGYEWADKAQDVL